MTDTMAAFSSRCWKTVTRSIYLTVLNGAQIHADSRG